MSSTILKKILFRAMLVFVLCGLGYGLAKLPTLIVGYTLRHERPDNRPPTAPTPSAEQNREVTPPAAEHPEATTTPSALPDNANDSVAADARLLPADDGRQGKIYGALKTVIDPEMRLSVVELGLIRRIDHNPDGSITVTMTLTSPLCPYLKELVAGIREAVQPFAPGKTVHVEIDFSRPWSPDDLSPEGRRKLFGEHS